MIGEQDAGLGPDNGFRQVSRKHENNRIEGNRAIHKRRLRQMLCLPGLTTAKAALKGLETVRAIRRAEFDTCETGMLDEISFVRSLFHDARKAV
ncbi:MAG: hypothetical protein WA957_16220 [Alteraurantiacibacter sp.]